MSWGRVRMDGGRYAHGVRDKRREEDINALDLES